MLHSLSWIKVFSSVLFDQNLIICLPLSSLSKSASGENWVVLDDSDPSNRRKYYINVCRPLAPVYGLTSATGCDLTAAVCQTVFEEEKVISQVELSADSMFHTSAFFFSPSCVFCCCYISVIDTNFSVNVHFLYLFSFFSLPHAQLNKLSDWLHLFCLDIYRKEKQYLM